ncbi:MAG: hypothetical protein QXM31_01430 [Candidatus Woesearchaeota archaeon]
MADPLEIMVKQECVGILNEARVSGYWFGGFQAFANLMTTKEARYGSAVMRIIIDGFAEFLKAVPKYGDWVRHARSALELETAIGITQTMRELFVKSYPGDERISLFDFWLGELVRELRDYKAKGAFWHRKPPQQRYLER